MAPTSSPLTPEELSWVADNADAVRALMKNTVVNPEPQPLPADPIEAATIRFGEELTKKIEEITRKANSKRKSCQKFERMLQLPSEVNPSPDFLDDIKESVAEFQAEAAHLDSYLSLLQTKMSRLKDDPKSLYLPLGTVVRFVAVPAEQDSRTYRGNFSGHPKPGSIGVVTNLPHDSEYPIQVSMSRDFTDNYGDEWGTDDEYFPRFGVDPEMIEVIGYGTYPNGQQCESFGFVPTHHHTINFDFDKPYEMIIQADGRLWRFVDYDDGKVEALHMYDRMEQMPWLTGVVDAFREPFEPDDSAAKPGF